MSFEVLLVLLFVICGLSPADWGQTTYKLLIYTDGCLPGTVQEPSAPGYAHCQPSAVWRMQAGRGATNFFFICLWVITYSLDQRRSRNLSRETSTTISLDRLRKTTSKLQYRNEISF